LVDQDLVVWIFRANAPVWVIHWYDGVAYILTATIVWLNRHRLAALNIDRPFIIAVMLGGTLYAFYLTPSIGVFVGMTAGFIYVADQYKLFVFSIPVPYPKGTGMLILLSIPLALAPVLLFRLTVKTPLSLPTFIADIFGYLQYDLALIVFEEVVFRGALWAYLRSLGLSEQTAFYVQAFLFWIAHHRILVLGHQYSFWVAVPCVSILLGLLAWRSKSLTPSTIAHFMFNFMTQLLLMIF